MLGEENKEQLVRGCETCPQQKDHQGQNFSAHVVRDAYEQRGFCICQTMLPNK